ncbi:pyridoxamine 5'-phosphate oxidase family protein [Staphylococcus sp. 11261D007BR]
MDQQVKDQINQVINNARIGVLSTAINNKPNSRYMIFYNDDIELYTKTSKKTDKIEELKQNPYVHVLLGYEENHQQPYIEIEGEIEIVTNQHTINWLWQNQDKTFFDSKNDPDLVVLRVLPSRITLLNLEDEKAPVTIDVSQL